MSVSAPKMIIRSRLPWPFRGILLAAMLGLGGAIAMWAYDLGRHITGFNPDVGRMELANLKEEADRLRTERDKFSATVNAAESRLNIERAAQKQLVTQVKTLESENTKLKEDLAFFESLLPADTGPLGISIRRLKAEMIAPNQLRYRLLVMQGGKGMRDFVGNVQLSVTVLQAGKSAMIVFPDGKTIDADKFKLGFKHYQRVEGILTLPEGATMKAVQARILEHGQIRAQQSANL